MNSASINIVLLPDNKVCDEAIRLSQSIGKELPAKFSLNGKDLIPHLTIYQAEFPKYNVEKVFKKVDSVIKKINPFKTTMSNFSATPQGNIWWNTAEKEEMKKIQDEVISKCNNLREGLLLPGLKEAKNLGSEYEQEIEKYGSLWVDQRCSPHLSISAMDPKLNEMTLEHLGEKNKMSFIANHFAIGTLGAYGTVTAILKNYNIN